MLTHYFNTIIATLKYKRHLSMSLYSCLFVWDNQTTVDTGTAREPSIYYLNLHVTESSSQTFKNRSLLLILNECFSIVTVQQLQTCKYQEHKYNVIVTPCFVSLAIKISGYSKGHLTHYRKPQRNKGQHDAVHEKLPRKGLFHEENVI